VRVCGRIHNYDQKNQKIRKVSLRGGRNFRGGSSRGELNIGTAEKGESSRLLGGRREKKRGEKGGDAEPGGTGAGGGPRVIAGTRKKRVSLWSAVPRAEVSISNSIRKEGHRITSEGGTPAGGD